MSNKPVPNPRPALYAALYPGLVEIARAKGYALCIHGSIASDLDLVAVQWVDEAATEQELVKALWDHCSAFNFGEGYLPEELDLYGMHILPGGRHAYTLPLFADWYVDLNVVSKEILK